MTKRQKQTKMPSFLLNKPASIINIQLRYKERDADGRLVFKGSKHLTAQDISLEDLATRIYRALERTE